MAGVVQQVAERFLTGWFAGSPGASLLTSALSDVFASTLDEMVSTYCNIAGGQALTADQLLRLAFAVPADASDEEAAEHITRLLLSWLPADCQSFAGSAPDRAARPGSSLAPGPTDSSDSAALDELLYGQKDPPKRNDQTEKVKKVLIGMGSVVPKKWTLENVVRALEELRSRFTEIAGKHTKAALDKVQEESKKSLPMRGAVAGAFTAGGALATVVSRQIVKTIPSTAPAGKQVHAVLQERYRVKYSQHLVVQESRAYRPLPPGITRVGKPPYEQLSKAAKKDWEKRGDASLAALFLARQPALLREVLLVPWGTLRDDTIDMTFAETWEIKPITGALHAVGQEFFYRSSYNVFAGLMQDLGVPIHTKAVRIGAPWDDADLSAIFAIDGALVGTEDPVFAVPLAIQQLPGLVLYLLASIPLRALKRLVKDMLKEIEEIAKLIEALFGDLAEAVKKICEGLVVVAMAVGLAAAAVALIGPELAAAGASAVIVGGVLVYRWITDGQPSPGQPAQDQQAQSQPAQGEQAQDQQGQAQAEGGDALPERVTVALGPIRLVDIPMRLLVSAGDVPAVADALTKVVKGLA